MEKQRNMEGLKERLQIRLEGSLKESQIENQRSMKEMQKKKHDGRIQNKQNTEF